MYRYVDRYVSVQMCMGHGYGSVQQKKERKRDVYVFRYVHRMCLCSKRTHTIVREHIL